MGGGEHSATQDGPDPSLASRADAPRGAPEAVIEALDALVEPEALSLARAFADAMLRRVPEEVLRSDPPDAVAQMVARAFEFVLHRPEGGLKVRLVTEADEEAPGSAATVVELLTDDRPFLMSSVTASLTERGHDVIRAIHPVLGVQRDDDDTLTAIHRAQDAEHRESFIHVQLGVALGPDEREEIENELREVIADVITVTDDHDEMRERLRQAAEDLRDSGAPEGGGPTEDPAEASALLKWLLDDNFLLLGTRDYDIVQANGTPAVLARPGSGLGMLAGVSDSRYAQPVPLEEADASVRSRQRSEQVIAVARSRRVSRVHQRSRMLNVWVKRYDDDGDVVGDRRLIGLFTRRAHSERASVVPVLRRKLRMFLDDEDVLSGSHDERTFIGLFEAMPKEELFELDLPDLRTALLELVAAEEERSVRALVRVDDLTRTVSVIVSVPRERYGPELRRRIQGLLLERLGGSSVDVDLSLGDRPDAVVRFAVQIAEDPMPDVDASALEAEIKRLARTWLDDLTSELLSRHGGVRGRELSERVGERMPTSYCDVTPVDRAASDIEAIARLIETGNELDILIREDRPDSGLVRVKLLKRGAGMELSSVLPIIESLGLTAVEELPFRLRGEPEIHLHDYGLRSEVPIEVDSDGPRIAAAIAAAWRGELEVDSLNRLVVSGRCDHTTVSILRAYRRYRRQVGTVYTAEYQNDALARNPEVVRALAALFERRFDPGQRDVSDGVEAARHEVLAALDGVERLDEDRILRDFLALIDATVRTNRYRSPGTDTLALKLDSARVPSIPAPVPHREIFVFSPTFEGIHLRGGPVARGGIRWSDRRDDFRNEVLALMQAQMLKNALIVPDGAKGGFVLKDPPADREAFSEAGRAAYRHYIGALLDVTDDVAEDAVVGPEGVVRHDGDDPYLVVAADRGTATFSDLANEIAVGRGFWLGDAFASGGSKGYDHKELGITARGAWVAVQRHFAEIGVDVQTEPIDVVGIGDMSGDVFGNAMLLSRAVRLVAAFDHRHIFIDPDPDPERSFEARRSLAGRPGSSWADYDRSALSDGGGVWARTEKSVPLSEEVQRLLRVEEARLAPPDLMRAILQAPADLLFAGGIGTFVKAVEETNDEIGDRDNAEVRIDATDLRARVVAEGANLALTQRARIQYARRGGRVNTDFVDNAAGVDISDHEVNLKILLELAISRGKLAPDERDVLLSEVTDDVVAACLEDVRLQTRLLHREATTSPQRMETLTRLMADLEGRGMLDRSVEALPTTDEMQQRSEAGAGLTRPELAVIVAAAKRDLAPVVSDSDLPADPSTRPLLAGYFPDLLSERFAGLLEDHQLRSQLIGTELGNEIVDRMGSTFAFRLGRELGEEPSTIVSAYWIARCVIDADRYWSYIDDLEERAGPEIALEARMQLEDALEALTREYVRRWGERPLPETIETDRPSADAIEEVLASSSAGQVVRRRAERYVDAGTDTTTAALLASVGGLALTPDVAGTARALARGPREVAEAFVAMEEALPIERLHSILDEMAPVDRWERWEHGGLIDDLRALHRIAAHRALSENPATDVQEAVDRFAGTRSSALRHAERLALEVESDPDDPPLSAIAVAVRALRDALREPGARP